MTPYGGTASVTPGFATSTKIDLNQIGEARNSMLGIKLDQVSESEVVLYLMSWWVGGFAGVRLRVWADCGGPQGLFDRPEQHHPSVHWRHQVSLVM